MQQWDAAAVVGHVASVPALQRLQRRHCAVNPGGQVSSCTLLNAQVMIAACDTFRSGAVEQLKTHCGRLGVPLYERGGCTLLTSYFTPLYLGAPPATCS